MKVVTDNKIPEHIHANFLACGIQPILEGEAELYYPAGKASSKRTREAVIANKSIYYLQIPGIEFICTKDWLWMSIVRKYGRQKALSVLPKTYVLRSEADRNRLKKRISEKPTMYLIAKGKRQKRQSLLIIKGIEYTQLDTDKFIIVQELIKCSPILNNQIFNLRTYIVLEYSNKQVSLYLLQQGKIIYSESQNHIITDNKIKPTDEYLPLYIDELFERKFLLNETEFWDTLGKKASLTVSSIIHKVFECEPTRNGSFTTLMGVDVILDSNNNIKILEFNLRPELNATDEKDRAIKESIFHDNVNSFLLKKEETRLKWNKIGQWNNE